MTPKGKKQITNEEIEKRTPVVRARVTNSILKTLLQNAIHQLSKQDEDLEQAIQSKPKKKKKEDD